MPWPYWRRRRAMRLSSASSRPLVVTVGGSLYDLPDRGPRLRHWLTAQEASATLLVPGGGGLAETVRTLDAAHRLGEETSHWLALRALTVAAPLLAALLPGATVVDYPQP